MSKGSIAYGLDDVYYMDKFTEEDYPYEHYLNNDLYDETYFREEELREFSRYARYHGKPHYEQAPPTKASVEQYLRSNPALYDEPIPRGRPVYPASEHMEPHHMYEQYQQRSIRHYPHPSPQYRQYHRSHMPRKPVQQHHAYERRLRADPASRSASLSSSLSSGLSSVSSAHKKFRKKTNKHAEQENSRTRKTHKGQKGHYFKQPAHYTSRIRIHGDSWKESSEGFVGLVGKGGHKIGIYRTDKIDPLLPMNNHHKAEKDKHTTIDSSNFNTYHAGAFWRLFGVEINNVTDFRQTVGDRIVGFAVRPDGDVVVKTISFTANAAVNIVKVLDVLEDMRVNGFRSRSVQELTTEGTIQSIVEQWMDGKKVIEMSL